MIGEDPPRYGQTHSRLLKPIGSHFRERFRSPDLPVAIMPAAPDRVSDPVGDLCLHKAGFDGEPRVAPQIADGKPKASAPLPPERLTLAAAADGSILTKRWRLDEDGKPACLAHRPATAVEAAYRRGSVVEHRRAVMVAWAAHLFP